MDEEIRRKVLTLLDQHRIMTIATLRPDGWPQATTVGYVNDGLTLDFIDTEEAFPIYHFCFRVTEDDFDAILKRIEQAGIAYRSSVRGPMDNQVSHDYGGRGIYWNEPDGHQWEMLTVSYARADFKAPA